MITDLIGGQIHATINGKSVLRQHIASRQGARARRSPRRKRWDDMKDVPTLMEVGFLDAPYDTLFGIVAPAGVPAAIVERLNAVINEGLRSAEMRAGLDKLGIEPLRHDAGGVREARRGGSAALERGGGADRHQGAVTALVSQMRVVMRGRVPRASAPFLRSRCPKTRMCRDEPGHRTRSARDQRKLRYFRPTASIVLVR